MESEVIMAQSRRKQDYDNKYRKEHYKNYCFRMIIEKDQDLMEYYEQIPKKNEYIKALIKADMEKTQS